MIQNNNKNLVIVSVENIGFRHFQGALSFKFDFVIYVVDPLINKIKNNFIYQLDVASKKSNIS